MSAPFEGGDLAAVEQAEDRLQLPAPFPAVPVSINGPVQVQAMPTITGAPRTWAAVDAASKILGKDDRRASVTLLSQDEPFAFGFNQAECDAGTAATWPINVPLVLRTREEVWLRTATAGTPALVTVVPENWAA